MGTINNHEICSVFNAVEQDIEINTAKKLITWNVIKFNSVPSVTLFPMIFLNNSHQGNFGEQSYLLRNLWNIKPHPLEFKKTGVLWNVILNIIIITFASCNDVPIASDYFHGNSTLNASLVIHLQWLLGYGLQVNTLNPQDTHVILNWKLSNPYDKYILSFIHY